MTLSFSFSVGSGSSGRSGGAGRFTCTRAPPRSRSRRRARCARRRPELAADRADVRVDGARARRHVVAPHLREQLLAGRDPTGARREVVDEVELDRREVHELAVDAHPARRRRRARPRRSARRARRGDSADALGPAQQRVHPGDQLAHAERLRHVVVGADREPDEEVGLAVAGGEHQDRAPARSRWMRLQTSMPSRPGSMRSSTTRSGWMRSQSVDAARAVGRDLDRVALAAQAGGDGFGDRPLVLDHDDRPDQPVSRSRCKRGHTTRIRTGGGGVPTGLWRKCADRAGSLAALRRPSAADAPDARARSAARDSRPERCARRGCGSVETCAGSRAARPARRGRSTCVDDGRRDAIGSCCAAIPASTSAQSDRSTEYALLEGAAAAGVPVPRSRDAARAGRRPRARVRHGPRRGRDDPPTHSPRRRVRRGAPAARGAVRRDRGAHPRDRPGDAAAARRCRAPPRRSTQYRDAARHVRRTASRVRARPALARRAHAAGAAPSRRSCTATSATATSSSAPRASARCSTGSSRTSAIRSRTSAGCA